MWTRKKSCTIPDASSRCSSEGSAGCELDDRKPLLWLWTSPWPAESGVDTATMSCGNAERMLTVSSALRSSGRPRRTYVDASMYNCRAKEGKPLSESFRIAEDS